MDRLAELGFETETKELFETYRPMDLIMPMNDILQIETAAAAGGCPWGGTEVSNDMTPMQMMEKTGVDWTEKVPTTLKRGTVDLIPRVEHAGAFF